VYPKTNGLSLWLGVLVRSQPRSHASISLLRALVAHILLDSFAALGRMLDPTFGASDPALTRPNHLVTHTSFTS